MEIKCKNIVDISGKYYHIQPNDAKLYIYNYSKYLLCRDLFVNVGNRSIVKKFYPTLEDLEKSSEALKIRGFTYYVENVIKHTLINNLWNIYTPAHSFLSSRTVRPLSELLDVLKLMFGDNLSIVMQWLRAAFFNHHPRIRSILFLEEKNSVFSEFFNILLEKLFGDFNIFKIDTKHYENNEKNPIKHGYGYYHPVVIVNRVDRKLFDNPNGLKTFYNFYRSVDTPILEFKPYGAKKPFTLVNQTSYLFQYWNCKSLYKKDLDYLPKHTVIELVDKPFNYTKFDAIIKNFAEYREEFILLLGKKEPFHSVF